MNIRPRIALLGATGAIALLSASAHAQDRPPADGDIRAERLSPDNEIVVTASKRNERLKDVPFAISVVQTDSQIAKGATRLSDIAASVPGLTVTNGGAGVYQSQVVIRGITTGAGGNPTVGVYIDDTPFNSSTSSGGGGATPDLDPADLERIEVLRGPQGTLYGATSMGGLIRYVTKAPDPAQFSGRISIDRSTVDHGGTGYGVRGGVNLPLGDGVAIRASGFSKRDPGYIDNAGTGKKDFNDTESYGGRVALGAELSPGWKVDLAGIYQHLRTNGQSVVDYDALTGAPIRGNLVTSRVPGTDRAVASLALGSARIQGDLGFGKLVSETSYGFKRFNPSLDYSPVIGPLLQAPPAAGGFGIPNAGGSLIDRTSQKKFTQELRITSNPADFLEWQFGGFYTRESGKNFEGLSVVDQTTGAVIAGTPDFLTANIATKYEEVAAFGSVTAHLTSQLDIIGGIRVSHNTVDVDSVLTGILGGPPADITQRSSETPVTFLVNPRFKVSPSLTIYARVASGYRPGGPNVGASGALASFGSDRLMNYEIGVKGDAFNRLVTFSADVFFIDWSKVQVRAVNPDTGLQLSVNAGKVHSRGFEAEATIRPVAGLSFHGNISYVNATLATDLPTPFLGAEGDRLPYSAKWSGTAGIDYSLPIGGDWKANAGGEFQYIGSREGVFESVAAIPRYELPAYGTGNLNLGVGNDRFNINLFVRNVTDKRGFDGVFRLGAFQRVAVARPRTIGISAATTF